MEKLKQILKQDDTVLFIGSGVSLWSGLPSWAKLINELAEYVEQSGSSSDLIKLEALNGDLLQAASYGFDKLTTTQIGDFIRTACLYGTAKPHEVHKKIVHLGPSCYITTNYDNLIEESLRLWRPDVFYSPPVTNRNLTNLADIVGAGSRRFIFKHHGDAADSDSIILTREQYRQLLPDGERHSSLESVKTLLATRPVVYIGFGLRDPDFIYMRDILINTYSGGIRDHYAIMADVGDQEIDYWRKHYGIHLLSYPTLKGQGGGKDHSPILALLDSLKLPSVTPKFTKNIFDSDVLLALARLAGRTSRFAKKTSEFPIRVSFENLDKPRIEPFSFNDIWRYSDIKVEQFLDSGPNKAILVGLPGAGKTYSLRQSLARLSETLNRVCLAEKFIVEDVEIPIFIDLKLYAGKILELIENVLPDGLTLSFLLEHFKVKFLLDSFNEMPREYWEDASYEPDLVDFIGIIGSSSLIISSRTLDGLNKLNFPCFNLDQIEEKYVIDEIEKIGIKFKGRFEREILKLLQKPFYFQLILNRIISLPSEPHPKDFYANFFNGLAIEFFSKFQCQFDLQYALSLIAFEAIDRGEEAQSLDYVLRILTVELASQQITEINASDIANWLVSKSVLIPYTGTRIAFFHQSATEYLAACELVQRYKIDSGLVKQKLTIRRWDQALFLALSLLSNKQSRDFLNDVVNADFILALNASKYLEIDRDKITNKLLKLIPSKIDENSFSHELEQALTFGVAITEVHEPILRKLVLKGNSIGGAALTRLAELKGQAINNELIPLLFDYHSDYNFGCNGIAVLIEQFFKEENIGDLIVRLDEVSDQFDKDNESYEGLTSGCGRLLGNIKVATIRKYFLGDGKNIPRIRVEVICAYLSGIHREFSDSETNEALKLCSDLLLLGHLEVATSIYFLAQYKNKGLNLSWDCYTLEHVNILLENIQNENFWIVNSLKLLCSNRKDFSDYVARESESHSGFTKTILKYLAYEETQKIIVQGLLDYLEMSPEIRQKQPMKLLDQMDFDWVGQEQIFLKLLLLNDSNVLEGLFSMGGPAMGILPITSINVLFDVFIANKGNWFIENRIPSLVTLNTADDIKKQILSEFNNPKSKYRKLIMDYFLYSVPDITTEDFSQESIEYLLNDIKNSKLVDRWRSHILGSVATEPFVRSRILPLYFNADNLFKANLKEILQKAGSRHGLRYI